MKPLKTLIAGHRTTNYNWNFLLFLPLQTHISPNSLLWTFSYSLIFFSSFLSFRFVVDICCTVIWRVLISSQNLLTLLIEISNWMSCLSAINHFVNIHKSHIWVRVAFALKPFSYNMPFGRFFRILCWFYFSTWGSNLTHFTFYIKQAIVIRLNVHCNRNQIECRWMVGHLLFHNTSKCFYYISSSVRHMKSQFLIATWMQFFNCLPVQIGWRQSANGTGINWLRQ